MIIVIAFDLETRQYDAVNAFVNSSIDEPIYYYISQKHTAAKTRDTLLFLFRAFYNFKQSPAL